MSPDKYEIIKKSYKRDTYPHQLLVKEESQLTKISGSK
ncbi:MAG: hypothetical protein K0R14_1632 [Burkholderiales bacterium]|jgi:hypothetical protein|nr:hypothetical protein [Burkholderiales bacterium]